MHLDLPPKLYYSIGEVSKAFKVNASLIRFWEKEFTDLNPKKNSKGTRRYSSVDIEKLQIIHHLVKEKGMTLQGAKKHLQQKTFSTFSFHPFMHSFIFWSFDL